MLQALQPPDYAENAHLKVTEQLKREEQLFTQPHKN